MNHGRNSKQAVLRHNGELLPSTDPHPITIVYHNTISSSGQPYVVPKRQLIEIHKKGGARMKVRRAILKSSMPERSTQQVRYAS